MARLALNTNTLCWRSAYCNHLSLDNPMQSRPDGSPSTILGLEGQPATLEDFLFTVEVEDTPSVRGMINKVNYLVRVED